MTADAITCYGLSCDVKTSADCEPVFVDRENEATVHGATPEQVRGWAAEPDDGWITLPDGRDACPPCREKLKSEPHTFMPYERDPSICRLCDQWATEGPHGMEVMVGQLEAVPVAVVLEVGFGRTTCSACRGNASPFERQHIHGGPGNMWQKGSGTGDENGCRAVYTECRGENGDVIDWPVKQDWDVIDWPVKQDNDEEPDGQDGAR